MDNDDPVSPFVIASKFSGGSSDPEISRILDQPTGTFAGFYTEPTGELIGEGVARIRVKVYYDSIKVGGGANNFDFILLGENDPLFFDNGFSFPAQNHSMGARQVGIVECIIDIDFAEHSLEDPEFIPLIMRVNGTLVRSTVVHVPS